MHVLVIGGGITGLSAAYYLRKGAPDLRVTVLEKKARVGGNIITERCDGFVLDGGPDSFLATKPEALELCRELDLGSELVRPRAHVAYVARGGRLLPMPAGMVLGIPTRIWPFVRSELLSWPGKLRVASELFTLRGHAERDDESIEAFLTRHFGREAARTIGAPLLGGIFAGDASALSVEATFPELRRIEARYGSLIRGFLKERRRRAADTPGPQAPAAGPVSPFVSLRGGMQGLVDKLVARLGPDDFRLGAAFDRVARSAAGGFTVVLASGERLEADAVVMAVPAPVAAKLVPDTELATELRAVDFASTATVFLAFDERALPAAVDGVGFVAPPGESGLIAATWVSSKWAERAPEGTLLIRAFVGGARTPAPAVGPDAGEAELVPFVLRELERFLGPLGSPRFSRVFRYPEANPQPTLGHRARLDRIAARLQALPGLALAGAGYDGVGIPDCIRQGRLVAERIRNGREGRGEHRQRG